MFRSCCRIAAHNSDRCGCNNKEKKKKKKKKRDDQINSTGWLAGGVSLYLQGNSCNVIGVEVEEEMEVGHDSKEWRSLLVLNVVCQCVEILCV